MPALTLEEYLALPENERPFSDQVEIYFMLSEGLRQIDEKQGQGLMKRLLARHDSQYQFTLASIQALRELHNPNLAPADLLEFLQWHVGFTSELEDITRNLDPINRRRLIILAIPLWKQKGTEAGLISVVRLLTGQTPAYQNWFDLRFIVGEYAAGDAPFITGGDITYYDEYTSYITLMDDGSLDPTLLAKLVDLERPTGERIGITILDFLDLFEDGQRNRWRTIEGTQAAVDSSDGTLEIPVGTWEDSVVPAVPHDSLSEYTSLHQFNLGAEGNIHVVRWYYSETTERYYQLEVTDDFATHGFNLRLTRFGTVPEVLHSAAFAGSLSIVPGYPYTLQIETTATVSPDAVQITVLVEGNHQFGYSDEDYEFTAGSFGVYNDAGSSAANKIDNVQIWRPPLRFALVGPNGTEVSSSYYGA